MLVEGKRLRAAIELCSQGAANLDRAGEYAAYGSVAATAAVLRE